MKQRIDRLEKLATKLPRIRGYTSAELNDWVQKISFEVFDVVVKGVTPKTSYRNDPSCPEFAEQLIRNLGARFGPFELAQWTHPNNR